MLINSIRLYAADMDNVDGYPLPAPLSYPDMDAAATRLAMKLREMGFELGDYNDLKLNFTPCVARGIVQHAQRTAPSKLSHYVDVGVSREVFMQLKAGAEEGKAAIMPAVRQALLVCYGPHHEEREMIRTAYDEAEAQGEDLEILVQEKKGLFNRGQLTVRYLNSGRLVPRLTVKDRQDRELLSEELPEVDELDALGDIQLGMRKASIHYRYGDQGTMTFQL